MSKLSLYVESESVNFSIVGKSYYMFAAIRCKHLYNIFTSKFLYQPQLPCFNNLLAVCLIPSCICCTRVVALGLSTIYSASKMICLTR